MKLQSLLLATFLCAMTNASGATVAPDGFPTGQDTPEGVAADLARAFIQRDSALFEKICLPLYGSQRERDGYGQFRTAMKKSIDDEAKRAVPSPGAPKTLAKVFAARQLSLSGAASYGFAVLGFDEVQFVDVGVVLVNGQRGLNRTLVVKKGGIWFVHPLPSVTPLLSAGLNEEKPSEADWTEKSASNQSAESKAPVGRGSP